MAMNRTDFGDRLFVLGVGLTRTPCPCLSIEEAGDLFLLISLDPFWIGVIGCLLLSGVSLDFLLVMECRLLFGRITGLVVGNLSFCFREFLLCLEIIKGWFLSLVNRMMEYGAGMSNFGVGLWSGKWGSSKNSIIS